MMFKFLCVCCGIIALVLAVGFAQADNRNKGCEWRPYGGYVGCSQR